MGKKLFTCFFKSFSIVRFVLVSSVAINIYANKLGTSCKKLSPQCIDAVTMVCCLCGVNCDCHQTNCKLVRDAGIEMEC